MPTRKFSLINMKNTQTTPNVAFKQGRMGPDPGIYPNPLVGWRKQYPHDCSDIPQRARGCASNVEWVEVFKNTCCTPPIRKIQNKDGNRDMDYSYTHYGNLQRRCSTYKQNAFNFDISNNILFKNCCVKACAGGHTPIATYKYNNPAYNHNGAVSNRARLNRLKYNNIAVNTSYKEPYRSWVAPRPNIYKSKSKNKCFCNSKAQNGMPWSKAFHN